VLATVATAAAMLVPSAVDAAIKNCSAFGVDGSDGASKCSTITGIDRGSSLRVRSAPSLSAPIVDRLKNGAVIEVDCWTTGPRVKGDRYWVGIYGAGGPTFVPDYYVSTGNPAKWTRQFTRCT
jgi:hypothetical protein